MIALSIGKPLPAFFSNSIPKSGTNLVKQLVLGIPGISHNLVNHTIYGHFEQEKASRLRSLQQNQFGAGHIVYSEEWVRIFKELNMKQLIISRDPRDIVVSYVPFMKKFPNLSPITSYIVNDLKTDKERYLTIIRGMKNSKYDDINRFYRRYMGWFNAPNT
ncbi:sulfotransferase domain-containing protein [Pseudalkalibacillus sp. A8]|uniref:sulfotransferase domain-containing protein n=1 Tax=Pseudalkalibacillus sp. A8 TaxID=3382641 RepID=UPI0038B672D3